MELRCPILKFPQKNWTKHDVFSFFCGWHLKRPSYPSWRSCAVSNLTRICFGKFLVHKKTAPTKTYTKTPHPPEIPEKKPYEKKLSIQIIQSIYWIWCSKPQNETFLSILFPMYWSCWSTSICKSLESFSLIDPGWSISALNFGEGTCTESSIDIGIWKQRLISDVTKYLTWNWCSKKGLETCRLKQTLRYKFYLKNI